MQLPSVVSQRVDQSSPKFATADRWGHGVLQQVPRKFCSLPYDSVC
jgi:hypothetical protein